MSSCDCDDTGPEFILNPAIGTAPCPTGTSTTTTPTPCPPSACCNFFRTDEALGSNNFVFTAGGPFLLHTGGVSDGLIPPIAGAGFANPGPLLGIVCIPAGMLAPGTYRVMARMEIFGLAAIGGNSVGDVNVVLFPDCTDASVGYVVSECLGSGTCTGELYVTIDGCEPGFAILSEFTGGGPVTFRNFQISLERVSGRSIVDCGNSPLSSDDFSTSTVGGIG